MYSLVSVIAIMASVLSFPLDTTKHTGAIPYETITTPSGGLAISVLFQTAKTHSSPSVSLQYNSQAGNGNAGYGWNVGGVSSIDLVPRSIYYDGECEAIPPAPGSYWEAYTLDGVRLVPNTDPAFSAYQFVTAQGDIYVKKNVVGTCVSSFEVLRPDGSKDIYGFSAFGFPEWRTASNSDIQSLWYDFDNKTGNLNWRVDDRDEYFCEFGTYDAMDRLINVAYWVDGPDYGDDFDIIHNTSGSISSIEGVGTMAHADQDHVHRITQFTASSDNLLPEENLTIEYTSFGRPSHISRDYYDAYFTYNAAHQRVKMDLLYVGETIMTRYYLGGQYEYDVFEDTATERLYLGGDYYDSPMVMTKDYDDSSWSYLQLFRDYLGSITTITDYSGTVLAGYSYDAWGRLRNPNNLEAGPYDADHQPDLLIGRGYTGHEHLPWFGLINMNARLYDPVTARFLSPDPYIQLLDNTQNFNRYAYALNNPLKYTDENGESWLHFQLSGSGIKLGINFTKIPNLVLAAGVSWSWTATDNRFGVYGELGYTSSLFQVYVQQSFEKSTVSNDWFSTTSVGASFTKGLTYSIKASYERNLSADPSQQGKISLTTVTHCCPLKVVDDVYKV